MKTENTTNVSSVKTRLSETKSRKTLNRHQSAATGKENLVEKSRVLRSKSGPLKDLTKDEMSAQIKRESPTEKPKKTIDVKKTKKVTPTKKGLAKATGQRGKIKIEVDDLTSEAGPSEDYYKILAEKRRIALENALEENHELHDKNKKLEEEINLYKNMLDESRALVEVLQEMLGEDQPDIENSLDDSVL